MYRGDTSNPPKLISFYVHKMSCSLRQDLELDSLSCIVFLKSYIKQNHIDPEFIDQLHGVGLLAKHAHLIGPTIISCHRPGVDVVACISRLLQYQPQFAKITDKNNITHPLLFFACGTANLTLLSMLLDAGADPNEIRNGFGVFHFTGSEAASQLLVQRGAKPNPKASYFYPEPRYLILVAYLRLEGHHVTPSLHVKEIEEGDSYWYSSWQNKKIWKRREYTRMGGADGIRRYIFFRLSLCESLLYLLDRMVEKENKRYNLFLPK